MAKIMFLDTETSGLDPEKHSILQLAAIIDSQDGETLDEINLFIKPFKGDFISKSALEKNKITIDDIKNDKRFLKPADAFNRFIKFLGKHVNRYDKTDKLIICGKNVKFDIQFLRAFFDKCNNYYYSSWFHYPSIDIESEFAKLMAYNDIILHNYQLEPLCDFFEINLKAPHDALEDIKAIRKIYYFMNTEDDL